MRKGLDPGRDEDMSHPLGFDESLHTEVNFERGRPSTPFSSLTVEGGGGLPVLQTVSLISMIMLELVSAC